jgi:hypothetical protein
MAKKSCRRSRSEKKGKGGKKGSQPPQMKVSSEQSQSLPETPTSTREVSPVSHDGQSKAQDKVKATQEAAGKGAAPFKPCVVTPPQPAPQPDQTSVAAFFTRVPRAPRVPEEDRLSDEAVRARIEARVLAKLRARVSVPTHQGGTS